MPVAKGNSGGAKPGPQGKSVKAAYIYTVGPIKPATKKLGSKKKK